MSNSPKLATPRNSIDALTGPRLKLQRANEHIASLLWMTNPLAPSLYDISIERENAPSASHNTMYRLTYSPKVRIPETLALIIGDAIHNLRAALDHLASSIVRCDQSSNSFHFPIGQLRNEIINSQNLIALEEALPGARAVLLDQLRPADGHNEHLWGFNTLDNDDKHDLIIPSVTIASITMNGDIRGAYLDNCSVGNDASRPIVLFAAHGAIIYSGRFEIVVSLKFGMGTQFAGEPVIPTLRKISNLVTEVIAEFRILMDAAGTD